MTNLIVKDLQKQDPGSELIELFELELDSSTTVYFHSGVEEDLSTVQFRQEGGAVKTYVALPLQAKGFKADPKGTSARPSISFANVSNIFKNTVSDFDSLLGSKITRRTTLKKYLVGESGDSTPPVEFPKQIFLLDRIASSSKTAITFECATPYDLQGITLPKRQVIANGCPWIYQGADYTLNEYEKVGACTWNRESKYKASYTSTLDGYVEYISLVNLDDEYVVPGTGETGAVTFSTSVSSILENSYYTTNTTLGGTVRRLSKDGSIDTSVDGNNVPNYWQAAKTTGTPGTLSDTNAKVKRVRIWDTYSSSTTYYAYTDDRYNDFVRHTADGLTKLWKAKKTSVGQTPGFGEYWEPGDICSKTLTACKMRFGFNPISVGTASSTGRNKPNTEVVLPFGGFPGAKRFS
jgi:lambda family phage minor tail protein L